MNESLDENPFFRYYRRYVGDPDRTVDVYAGFGLFFAGLGLGAVGVVLFLYSATLPGNELSTYGVREVAAVAAAFGLPALLVGVVVLLPVDRRMLYVAGTGSVVCLAAIGLFAWAYPYNWNVTPSPDYSAQGVAIYSTGLVLVIASTGAALVAHRVEQVTAGGAIGTAAGGSRATKGDAETVTGTETVTDADVQADIDRELADVELTWGGVSKKKTRHLKLESSTVDDVDRERLRGSATETRKTSGSVNDAVSQLKGLQGGEMETASGQGTDDQATALRELREQQQASEQEKQSVMDRVRDLI